jgi:hypothetical protein
MYFSLLGDHPDGLGMARGLAASGRHSVTTFTGPPAAAEKLVRAGLRPRLVRDIEEVLADPSISAVIVGSRLDDRPAHLRRALQSERHVLCVCPVDQTPDIAYEAAMIQKDTRCLLLPLLPLPFHPALARLSQLVEDFDSIGVLQLLQIELTLTSTQFGASETPAGKPSLPGWEIMRLLGGEITEVSAFARGNAIESGEPLLLSGQFDRHGVFQLSYLPKQVSPFAEFVATGGTGRAELVFPEGLAGPAVLFVETQRGPSRKETWESWDPWPRMVEIFEKALEKVSQTEEAGAVATGSRVANQSRAFQLDWQTAVRSLELDDAARRSVERRRASALEYPEASEEVGFKGTMTLVGCGVLWFILIVVILARWEPQLGWVIIPLLVLFLGMQLFRWVIPKSAK